MFHCKIKLYLSTHNRLLTYHYHIKQSLFLDRKTLPDSCDVLTIYVKIFTYSINTQ